MPITPPPWKAYPPGIVATIWPITPSEERQWWIAGDTENSGPGVALVARGLRMDDAILMAAGHAMLAALLHSGGPDMTFLDGPSTLETAAELLQEAASRETLPGLGAQYSLFSTALSRKAQHEREAIEQAITLPERPKRTQTRLSFGCPRCNSADTIFRLDFPTWRCANCGFRGLGPDFLRIVEIPPAAGEKGED